MFKRCTGFLGDDARSDLATLAGKAMELGKYLFAFRAYQALEDAASMARALDRLREGLPESSILLKQLEEEAGTKPDAPPETDPDGEKPTKGKKGK